MIITDEMLREAAHEVNAAIIAMFPKEECHHTFSERFERKMKKIIWRANHLFVYRVLKRVACLLIALLLSGSLLLAFNTEARAAVLDWVKDTFEGVYHYFFVGEEDLSVPKDYSLGWLPEGYMLLDSLEGETGKTFIYVSNTRGMLQFAYMFGSDANSTTIGNGEYEEKRIVIDGFQADVYIALTPGESNIIAWKDESGAVIFTITGFLEEAELVQAAQSLKIVEKS